MIDDRKPDRFEFIARFVFGALFGAFVGCFSVARDALAASLGSLTLEVFLPALICGICAAGFGDRFWLTLGSWLWFWW